MIRAAEQVGVQIPRFCDHPLLAPVGACRQCLVDIPDAGNGRGFPKPQASCTLPVAEGMVVDTQAHQPGRRQGAAGDHGVPADQPPAGLPGLRQGRRVPAAEPGDVQRPRRVPLPRVGASSAPSPSRSTSPPQVLLDRERCVLCARCTRFSEQIAGDPFIELVERGALQQVGIYENEPFESYFSGNTIQICPVGALTSAEYRFRSRPFDLVSTPSVAEHDACGCRDPGRPPPRQGDAPARRQRPRGQRGVDHRQGPLRVPLRHAPATGSPTRRSATRTASLRPASWPEAFAVAARGLPRGGRGPACCPAAG